MMSLDPTTRAAYNAEPTANGRANVVLSSLGSTVAVVVYDGPGNIMGSGMMQGTWATVAANVLTIGEVANFDVLADGTPDAASWYIRFEGAGRWARAPFGPTGDFTWSQSAFITGNTGTIGNASAAVPVEVVRTDLALAWDVAAGTVVVTFGWKAPTDLTLASSLVGTVATYDLSQEANLLGQPAKFTLQPPLVTGVSIDQATGLLTKAAGVVVHPGHEVLVDLVQNVGSLEQDWINRSTGPGVKWALDFRVEREVQQFRVSDSVDPYPGPQGGNDVAGTGVHTIYWDQTDGVGLGKCLKTVAPNGNHGFPAQTYWVGLSSHESKAVFPAGTTYTPITTNPTKGTFTFPGGATYVYDCRYRADHYFDPTNTQAYFQGAQLKYEGRVSAGGWARPLSALIAGTGGNGQSVADRGNPKRAFPADDRTAFGRFTHGHYGPTDLWVTRTLQGGQTLATDWDGTEFYIQFRVKFNPGRHAKRTPPPGSSGSGAEVSVWAATGQEVNFQPGGKLAFIQPGPDQNDNYTILLSGTNQRYAYQTSWLSMYSARGAIPYQDPQNGQPEPGQPLYYQNAGPYRATCNSANVIHQANKCWEWPENEWVTVLFYKRPGHSNGYYAGGYQISGGSVASDTRINVTLATPLPADAPTVLAVGSKLNLSGAFTGGWAALNNSNAFVVSCPDTTHLLLDTTVSTAGIGAYTGGGGFYFNASAWPYKDTGIKVWVARANETAYTLIFDKMDFAFVGFDGTYTPGSSINNIDFSCYFNNFPSWQEIWHKYTQVICSDQFIPCPAVPLP